MVNFIIPTVVELMLSMTCSSVFVDKDPNSVPSITFTTDDEGITPLSSVKVTPAIVFEKLQSLKSNKSPGPDGWPPIILKNWADHIKFSNQLLRTPCYYTFSGTTYYLTSSMVSFHIGHVVLNF